MKTFKQILDTIYSQSQLSDEAKAEFAEYTDEQKLAVTIALNEIWEAYEYPFKERLESFNTVASTANYDLPYGKLKRIVIQDTKQELYYVETTDTLQSQESSPYCYSLENNQINMYPVPDDVYTINMRFYTDNKAINGTTEKDTLELEDDVLNIPSWLESHFIVTLGYKAGMNLNSSPTSDEEYTHWNNNYNTALALLKTKSNRNAAPPSFRIGR